MKKILSISALALISSLALNGKTVDDLRVYINPGHGSWFSNDRPMDVHYMNEQGELSTKHPNTKPGTEYNLPDTTAFYETNTNLRKCFGLMEKLIDYGVKFDRTLNQENDLWRVGAALDMSNNIVFSHVKAGPYPASPDQRYYYNRNLTEVAKEVEANNFDMFISIHSNATNNDATVTNYPVFMYRGYDDTSKAEEGLTSEIMVTSKAMGTAAWKYAIENPHSVWSNTNPVNGVRGDINYMGSSSTVNGYKGYLGVLKHGVPGYLIEGYFHTYQPARHRAMNWDVDYVEGYAYARGLADYFGIKKDGKGWIYGQIRDLNERFSAQYYSPAANSVDRFLPINGATVTLKKDGETVETKVTDNFYNGTYVFMNLEPGTYTVEFSHPDYKAIDPLEVVVKADEVAYPVTRMENVNYVPDQMVYENYPDPVGKDNPMIGAPTSLTFEQTYVDQPIAELEGKTVRRMLPSGDMLYILALDSDNAPSIIVYNTSTKAVAATVSTEGMKGSELTCSDIALTADGVLLGSPKERTQYSNDYLKDGNVTYPRGTWRLYKWAKDAQTGLPTGSPVQLYTTQGSGLWYRAFMGTTITVSGTMEDGVVVTTAETTGASGQIRTCSMPLSDGKGVATGSTYPYGRDEGSEYRLYTSPNDKDNLILMGSNDGVRGFVYKMAHPDYTSPLEIMDAQSAKAAGLGFFRYAAHSYMTVNAVDGDNNVGARIVDVTEGYKAPKGIETVNTTLIGAPSATPHFVATSAAVKDADGNLTDAYVNMFALRGDKLSKFTTLSVAQPASRNVLAYQLNATPTSEADEYTISFMATGDAPAANIIITPAEGGDATALPLGAVVKGENTFTVSTADLPEGKYNWAITVQSKGNSRPGLVSYFDNGEQRRGSVITITDPEADSYGYTVTVTHRC